VFLRSLFSRATFETIFSGQASAGAGFSRASFTSEALPAHGLEEG
jgi:hypothetical protein